MKVIRYKQETIHADISEMQKQGLRLGIDYRIDANTIAGKELNNPVKWQEVEFFRPHWEERTKQMAEMISGSSHSVMDLGCGEGKARRYISDRTYIPVDWCEREHLSVVICDFNRGEFPRQRADTIFCAGVLEYIKNPVEFICKMCKSAQLEIVLSFSILELFQNIEERKQYGQHCFFASEELINAFRSNGYKVDDSCFWRETPLFRFVHPS